MRGRVTSSSPPGCPCTRRVGGAATNPASASNTPRDKRPPRHYARGPYRFPPRRSIMTHPHPGRTTARIMTPTEKLMGEIADEMERREKQYKARKRAAARAVGRFIAWAAGTAMQALLVMWLARYVHDVAPAVPAVGYWWCVWPVVAVQAIVDINRLISRPAKRS